MRNKYFTEPEMSHLYQFKVLIMYIHERTVSYAKHVPPSATAYLKTRINMSRHSFNIEPYGSMGFE
jgi:hypothetical protein